MLCVAMQGLGDRAHTRCQRWHESCSCPAEAVCILPQQAAASMLRHQPRLRGLTCTLSARVSCVPQLEAFKQFHEETLDELAVVVTARINAYEAEVRAQQDKLSSYRHKLSTYQHQCDLYQGEIRAYKKRAVSYEKVSEEVADRQAESATDKGWGGSHAAVQVGAFARKCMLGCPEAKTTVG